MEAFFLGEKGKSLSASALNDYLDCPLRFGLTYVYGLREPDDQDSPSDPKGFGKLIHQGLENLYQSFVNGTRNTSASSFQELLKDEKLLDTALRPLGHGGKGTAAYTGKDDIALLVAREFIISVLEKDMEDPPERIVGLEKTIVFPYGLNRDGFHGSLRLKAVIDRIDNYNGYTRVVDYKTGKCELNFTGIPELFDTSATQRKKEVFQVLFYSELIESLGMAESDIMPSIYPVIELRSGNRETRVTLKSEPLVYSAVREEFKAMLANLLSEIFDPSVPFRQTSIDNHCRLCPFSGICMKS
jgi:CRISPR/Cas system-associated exonuclease Cas4 (RecB family)